jgi:hypothetical protein
MAKKKAGGINMAAEIRELLRGDRTLTGSGVVAALKEKFPKESINENSASVALYNARKALGIKRKKRRRSGKKTTVQKRVPTAAPKVNLTALQAAAKFVAEMGSAEKAMEAVRQIRTLQIK